MVQSILQIGVFGCRVFFKDEQSILEIILRTKERSIIVENILERGVFWFRVFFKEE